MKKTCFSAAMLSLLIAAVPAKAQDSAQIDPAYLSLGVGIYDIIQHHDTATDFRLEYRHDKPLFWKIKPWFGAEATTDGTMWGGGGILADFHLADNIYVTPSFGAGLYTEGGSDRDLDSPLEFRSQLEGGYEFMNGHRVGVSFGHMSNGGTGDHNPGTEVLNIYYHMPVGSLF